MEEQKDTIKFEFMNKNGEVIRTIEGNIKVDCNGEVVVVADLDKNKNYIFGGGMFVVESTIY